MKKIIASVDTTVILAANAKVTDGVHVYCGDAFVGIVQLVTGNKFRIVFADASPLGQPHEFSEPSDSLAELMTKHPGFNFK